MSIFSTECKFSLAFLEKMGKLNQPSIAWGHGYKNSHKRNLLKSCFQVSSFGKDCFMQNALSAGSTSKIRIVQGMLSSTILLGSICAALWFLGADSWSSFNEITDPQLAANPIAFNAPTMDIARSEAFSRGNESTRSDGEMVMLNDWIFTAFYKGPKSGS